MPERFIKSGKGRVGRLLGVEYDNAQKNYGEGIRELLGRDFLAAGRIEGQIIPEQYRYDLALLLSWSGGALVLWSGKCYM